MTGPLALSEPHNFGQRVLRLENGWIQKPRTMFWERLFLSAGTFREQISAQFLNSNLQIDPFECFTCLSFSGNDLVECFRGEPVQDMKADEARKLGAAIALMAFFGVVDLNMENVQFARREQRFVFAPLDIECIGADVSHLAQSFLAYSKQVPEFKCGLVSLLPLLRKNRDALACGLLVGYLDTLAHALTIEGQLDLIMARAIGLERPPIRVLLRPTKSYSGFMNGTAKAKEFAISPLASEIEQMQRGDIPYYFRYPDEEVIYHYESLGNAVLSDANGHALVAPDRFVAHRRLSAPAGSRQNAGQLGLAGALQLARMLFADGGNGRSQFDSSFIECSGNELFLSHLAYKVKVSLNSN